MRSELRKTCRLSYHKDDRAMRPIGLYGMGALKIFESRSTPTAIFAEIFNWFFSDRSYEFAYRI